jgi:hypothetical protein
MTVAGVVRRRTGRLDIGWRVQAPFELAEDDAEQEMAPRRLDEGAAVAAQHGQFVARRVEAVGEGDERPAGEVLGQDDDGPAENRRDGERRRHVRVDGAE